MGEQYDIFFSYARDDLRAVRPVLAALTCIGLRVFHDETEITDGQAITRRINHGLSGARVLVAWYSTTYTTRRSCQWELTTAIVAAQQDKADARAMERRILVLNPELGIGHIQPLQLRDKLFLDVRSVNPDELAQRVAAQLDGLTGSFGEICALGRPTSWFGSNMRLGSNQFVGRVQDLWALHSGLSQHNFSMIGGDARQVPVQVLGMGGVGKTLLVEEYALRFAAAYPGGVFWLNAAGPINVGDALGAQILRLTDHLGLETTNKTLHQLESLLRCTLAERGRYLWVVDDLPQGASAGVLVDWSAPTGNGVTLVTTRSMHLEGSGLVHRLDVLSYDEAFELLTNRYPLKSEAEQAAVQEILSLLGNHALAIDVARAAVENLGYADFLNLLRHPGEDATEFAGKLVGELPIGHEPQITATLLDSINRLDEGGIRFLHLAALLAPAPIPDALVARVFSLLSGDEITGTDEAVLGIESATLESLAERVPGTDDADDAVWVHVLYPAHLRTRKSPGDMMRKLSVTRSQSVLHRLGTSRRRKPSTASQKPL